MFGLLLLVIGAIVVGLFDPLVNSFVAKVSSTVPVNDLFTFALYS